MSNKIDGVFSVIRSELPEGQPVWLHPEVFNRLKKTHLIDSDYSRHGYVLRVWEGRQISLDKDAPTDPKQIISYTCNRWERVKLAIKMLKEDK